MRLPTAAGAGELPDFVRRFDGPPALRRVLNGAMIRAIDSGWTGRTPLKTHVVICGFPRAGTTLLSLMMQVGYPRAKAFRKERAAIRVAYQTDRNHALMISKRPDDIFYAERLRSIYSGRRPALRFLLMMRDPRAILTSVHSSAKDRYYVSPARWRAIHDRMVANRDKDDCLLIRFEDMISDSDSVQAAIQSFIGEQPDVPFTTYVDNVPEGFRSTALNGVRPLDAQATTKWRHPRHAARLRRLLAELPELPDVLMKWGYEKDTAWVNDYLGDSGETRVTPEELP
jgi:hypothetical protein